MMHGQKNIKGIYVLDWIKLRENFPYLLMTVL